jgi:hypothetical protein
VASRFHPPSQTLIVCIAGPARIAVEPTKAFAGQGPREFAGAAAGRSSFEIRTLSNRADLISDRDALIEVRVLAKRADEKVTLTLNGANVDADFIAEPDARTLRGVFERTRGRPEHLRRQIPTEMDWADHGPCLTIIRSTSRRPGAAWLSGDTVILLRDADARAGIGQHAGVERKAASHDSLPSTLNCNNRDRIQALLPDDDRGLLDGAARPRVRRPQADEQLLQAVHVGSAGRSRDDDHDDGLTVPYIVRVERGTMNRGIYDIAVLFDPTQATPGRRSRRSRNGTARSSTLRRLDRQPRLQFRSEQNWADDAALSRGFMVVDNSLTDSLYNSNRILVAETLMMMKEHIVDSYGEIAYLMGNGCSGGSIQQNTARRSFRAARRHPAELRLSRFDHDRPRGHRLRAAGELLRSPEWTALMAG